MQVGLTSQEKQQLQGVSLDHLLAAMKAASFSFSTGQSAYRGVSFHKGSRKWQSQLQLHGKNNSLGRFSCEEDAADAHDKAAFAAFGRYPSVQFTYCVLSHLNSDAPVA